MKINTVRKQSGQVGAGDLLVFIPIFALLFAVLFNVAIMLIYTQRLAFLAAFASWYYAWTGDVTTVTAMVDALHLPGSTVVSYGGPIACNGAYVKTATASCTFTPSFGSGLGIPAVPLRDTEATMQPLWD